MPSDHRPTQASGVVARNIAGEMVLVPTRLDITQFHSIFLLSRVGAFLWQQLDGTHDPEELSRLVRERYAVPADHDVAADVRTFLTELSRRGLVQS